MLTNKDRKNLNLQGDSSFGIDPELLKKAEQKKKDRDDTKANYGENSVEAQNAQREYDVAQQQVNKAGDEEIKKGKLTNLRNKLLK